MTRQCTKCLREFPATTEHFPPDPRYSQGLKSWCRPCSRAYDNAWIEKNWEHRNALRRANRKANPERTKADRKRYYQLYKDKDREYTRQWRLRNPNWMRAYMAAWQSANRGRINTLNRERRAKNKELYGGGPARIKAAEAAKRMDVAIATVYSLLRRGQFTKIKIPGKGVFVLASEVAAYQAPRARKGMGRGKIVALDAPFQSGGRGVQGDIVADPHALDPEAEALRRADASMLLSWVKATLTQKQQRVLEAYAEADLDAALAGSLCGLKPEEVRAYITRIQKKAQETFASSMFLGAE